MSDYPKHSCTAHPCRRPRPSAFHFEPSPLLIILAAEQAEAQCRALAAGDRTTDRYSIRIATRPGTPCAECLRPTGHGPVGFCDDQPVCDRCLLSSAPPLGLTLCLVAVTRAFGAVRPRDPDDAASALAELGAFARIFEHVASAWGPARTFPGPSDGRPR